MRLSIRTHLSRSFVRTLFTVMLLLMAGCSQAEYEPQDWTLLAPGLKMLLDVQVPDENAST